MSGIAVSYYGITGERETVWMGSFAGKTIAEAVDVLQLPTADTIIPMVNKKVVQWDHILAKGDQLDLIKVIGGG
ncbi:MAG: MoaD/ThiS family protein [Anaerolineales bacterium]|nr:MoaD/ThiS family protein [Anaerolineales bacterium]